jgi:hypothetical protein
MVAASVRKTDKCPGASRANWLMLLALFYAKSEFGEQARLIGSLSK